MTRAKWLLPTVDEKDAAALAAALGIGRPAARVLCSRGFGNESAARAFLQPSLADLHPCGGLRDMDKAIARLRRAISEREKILIYGDYDVDGTTSVVILKRAIELAGGAAEFHVPDRLRDGYGMRAEVVEAAAARGCRLIVSVDTGIRASEVVRRAAALGLDVIITDHHLPEAELPPALAVLNPNRPDCNYPEKNLCGAGVAFKLVQALLCTLDWPAQKQQRVLESFLKLAAIATVADVVPLTGENRVIVKHGLAGLRSVTNPGLRALLDVAGIAPGTAPTASQVAFRVAPRANAAGRIENANLVIELFLTSDAGRARDLAAQLNTLNAERQQKEAEIIESILEQCAAAPIENSRMALVFCAPDWHRGVLGIVASRLVERFHRPVFVLSENAEDGLASGSGRGIPRFHLLEALESMPHLFARFGGHMHAAGLTMHTRDLSEFQRLFHEYAATRLTANDLIPQLEIDACLELGEIHERAVRELMALGPFGCGNPEPLFAALNVEVAGPAVVWKEKHLRVPLRQNGRTLWLKAWNFAGRHADFKPGARLDVALSLEEDHFTTAANGFPAWSAVIRDASPAELQTARAGQ